MNEYYTRSTFPEYIDLIEKQSKVPGQNFIPIIFNDLFSQEELLYIQKQFNDYPDNEIDVQGYAGLGTLSIKLLNEKELIKKIEKLASDAVGEELEVLEFGGTRYSPEFGWYPKLGPHYDARPVEMFVFDYHVQSNEDWGLFIEGKKFNFYDNDAILFSGTGQVHWREQIKLKEDSRVDLIFFWMQHKNPKPISEEHVKNMVERASMIINKINPMPTLESSDWWKPIQISKSAEKFPDFLKISTDYGDALKHNTIYRNIVHTDAVDYFYLNKSVHEDLKNHIINFMTHVHAQSKIIFKDIKYMHYSNKIKDFITDYSYNNEQIITLGVHIKSNTDFKIQIDNKTFDVPLYHAISFSFSGQDCKLDTDNFNEDEFVDILFFNFILEKNHND